jgi:hypothetical protein
MIQKNKLLMNIDREFSPPGRREKNTRKLAEFFSATLREKSAPRR